MQEKSLAPQQPDGADQDWAMEPTGAPEEFGFPAKPTVAQLRCWRNQERFLEEFAKCGIVGHAAKAAGVSVATVESWDFRDMHGFKKRKGWAAQAALGDVEREIHRRAIEGVDKPIIYKGQITGTYKEYSDNLLMFLAKRLDPAYKDNYQQPREDTHVPITQTILVVHDYQAERDARQRLSDSQGAVIEGQTRELPAEGDKSA